MLKKSDLTIKPITTPEKQLSATVEMILTDYVEVMTENSQLRDQINKLKEMHGSPYRD